jgi:hypothetical protein
MMQKDKSSLNAKGKARLQLKGRIYMANVTEIVCLQKPGEHFHLMVLRIKHILMSTYRSLSYSNLLEGRSGSGR